MQPVGVRQPPVREPEALVEALRVDEERIAVPASDGAAEVERVVGVALDLAFLFAGVCVDEPPVSITTAHHHEYPLSIALFQELDAEAALDLPRSPPRPPAHHH